MHTRRIATFLLGGWIAGCLMMMVLNVQNLRSPSLVLSAPLPPVAKMVEKEGYDQVALLLRHLAVEQTRAYYAYWQLAEFALGLAVGLCLFMATQRRILPLILCAIMLAAVAFQYFAVTPELGFRGRETDFPPGNAALGPMARVWALQQVYYSVEAIKLLAGAVLASFLFVFRARSRRSSKETERSTAGGRDSSRAEL